jgi:hypothetical protein
VSQYTKTTNFASKDNLSPGNPLKIVKGTEIDTEFNNIQTAVGTKTDNASAAITGGSITGITDLAVVDGGTGASTATAALNNLLPSQTSNANKYLQTDGTNASWDAVSLSTSDITGTLPVANGGTGVTSSTGTGNVVLSNSPTLVTPALGTPSALVGTNITGTASGLTAGNVTTNANLTGGVTSVGNATTVVTNANLTGAVTSVGNATSLGSFSSANLLAALTDETGTGSAVFATSPTLVTPALGTPSSATLTNATGLPISTGVSGLGTGVATFLGTPSSANLLAAVSDETGTGALVFATSPTLVTPALGTPSALVGTNITGTASGLTAGNVTTNANLTGAITSTGNATSLGSFSSANLLAALTDETGTGANVFATSPTLVTPILGTPTSATLTNATGLPLTTGVTGQLPVANGGTGTATPSIVAGTNVTVTGTWPNQTIAASGGGGSGTVTSVAATVPSLFSISGSPITTSGTLAMTYSGTALPVANGGTGVTTSTGTGNNVLSASPTLTGDVTLNAQGDLRFADADSSNWVAFQAPATVAANVTWTLPATDGTSAQVLSTNGSGTLSWATASGGSSQWTTSGSNIYYTTGLVSIGTTTTAASDAMLTLYNPSAATSQIYLQNTGTGTGSTNGSRFLMSATELSLTNKENGPIIFATNDTERARFTNTGYLKASDTGTYTNSTSTTNEFNNSANNTGLEIRSSNASFTGYSFAINADRNTTDNSYYFIGAACFGVAFRFRVADSGNVTNTNNSYGAISDVKLKENIVDASPKLADLMQVKVRNYNMIGDTNKQLGVVAQELETVFPSMIDESPDKDAEGNHLGTTTKAVKYSVFVPMLIKAIQEQQTIIESLKSRLDAANL